MLEVTWLAGVCNISSSLTPEEHDALCAAFPSGGQVWRIPLDHFSTHDFNWPLDFNQPNLVPSLEWANRDLPDAPCTTHGSTIGCEDQSLGEDLPITGTPFGLHYSSDRQAGRHDRYAFDIQIPDDPTLAVLAPVQFQGVRLEIQVAGQRLRYRSDVPIGAPDRIELGQPFHFLWDGLDGWGRQTQGAQPITVRIGFAFKTDYSSAPVGSRSFALAGGTSLGVNMAAREVVLWRTRQSLIGGWDARGEELGGFSISAHHVYDARARMLYRGDGTRLSSPGIGEVIEPYGSIAIPNAISLAAAPDGTLYVGQSGAGSEGTRIWRISRDGHTERFAGTSVGDPTPFHEVPPPSVAASAATFRSPVAMAVQRDGTLLVVESDNHCVRQIRDGLVTWFAGVCRGAVPGRDCTTTVAPLGDGDLATRANLLCPNAIAVAPDGAVYISELTRVELLRTQRIRRVDPGGVIQTFAALGIPFNGSSLAVDREGRLLALATHDLERIKLRRITAFAGDEVLLGSGLDCATGEVSDGMLGNTACIRQPKGVTVGPDGSVFVADRGQGRVRRLGPSGIVTTIAGGGASRAKIGPARSAQLNTLNDVVALPDGRVVIASDDGVRVVRPALPDVFVGQVVVPEPDGSLSYVFDERGKHLSTRHGLTGTVLLDFGYAGDVAAGALETITEYAGTTSPLITHIARGDSGPFAIVGPFGDWTTLTTTSGYLSALEVPTEPASPPRTWSFGYDPNGPGLLTTFTDPLAHVWTSTFDSPSPGLGSGRLLSERVPLGTRVVSLARHECGDSYFPCDPGVLGSQTILTEDTGIEPQTRQASVLELVSESWGGTRRRHVNGLGAETVSIDGVTPGAVTFETPTGVATSPTEMVPVSRQVWAPDGSTRELATGIDPRPGLGEYVRAARFCRDAACATPTTYTALRTVSPLTQTVTLNDTRTYTTTVEHRGPGADCPGMVTEQNVAHLDRARRTCLDAFGRVLRAEAPGMEPVVQGGSDPEPVVFAA